MVGSAGRIARPASRSRECHPWRAGVLPGVPPAPSLAPGRGPGFKRRSPLDSSSGWRARLRWPAAPTGFVPQPLGLLASTALPAPGQASGFVVGPVTGLAGAPRWRLRPPPGQPQPWRPSLPQDAALVAGTPRHPGLGGQVYRFDSPPLPPAGGQGAPGGLCPGAGRCAPYAPARARRAARRFERPHLEELSWTGHRGLGPCHGQGIGQPQHGIGQGIGPDLGQGIGQHCLSPAVHPAAVLLRQPVFVHSTAPPAG